MVVAGQVAAVEWGAGQKAEGRGDSRGECSRAAELHLLKEVCCPESLNEDFCYFKQLFLY